MEHNRAWFFLARHVFHIPISELMVRLSYREYLCWLEYFYETGDLERPKEVHANADTKEMTKEQIDFESQKQMSVWLGCLGKPRVIKRK